MKVLVTGAKGFLGKNLVSELRNKNYQNVHQIDRYTAPELLEDYCKNCDFIFHLAGVNRPENPDEFMEGNHNVLADLLKILKKHHNTCPVMLASSIQAVKDNPYGKSKKAAEDLLFSYSEETGAEVYVYRFTNIFGKWCKPNYNSVIATFCYNIAHNLPIQINNPDAKMKLAYIDDVVSELIYAMEGHANKQKDGFCYVETLYTVTLREIVDMLYAFKKSREKREIPDMTTGSFSKNLYSTYLSYLSQNDLSYFLKMNVDERGSFTEIFRTMDRGQFSVNISKPGVIKGNHWHKTKNEKFIVVKGNALIKLREVGSETVMEYHVNGEEIKVVDIPPGYTHAIMNVGNTDLITFMWCNECYDPEISDTSFLEVKKDA